MSSAEQLHHKLVMSFDQRFLVKHRIVQEQYPSYSPGLASYDFFLFLTPTLKKIQDVKNIEKKYNVILKDELQRCFDQWKTLWNIHSKGEILG